MVGCGGYRHDKHIRTNKIDNFDPPATVPDVYMIKIPVIREGLKNGNLEWNLP